jgi:hypothetical protein
MKELFKKYNKPALAIATFVALMHALWAALVAIGVAQTYLDWIFPMHFIGNVFEVLDFNIITAALLVIISFVASYVGTLLFGLVWKIMMKKK